MKLSGKIALITGAANGIGYSIAEKFSAEGAKTIIADLDYEKALEAARTLNASAYSCDIRKTTEINELVAEIISTNGRIDILVNNAAVAIPGNIMEMSEEDWDEIVNTNLTSVFRFIKAVLPQMLKQGSGSIINMASTQAHRSWNDWTAYAAAKGAIISMTRQLAGQFGSKNIRINSISPGTIATPMLERRIEKEGSALLEQSVKMHAMERLGRPEEVAALALLLAGDDSAFINGVDIKIDGGLSTLARYFE